MKTLPHYLFSRALVRPAITLALAGAVALPALARDDAHYIYALDNAVADNKVIVIKHNADGTLAAAGAVSTGQRHR